MSDVNSECQNQCYCSDSEFTIPTLPVSAREACIKCDSIYHRVTPAGECMGDGDICPGGESNCVGCLSFTPPPTPPPAIPAREACMKCDSIYHRVTPTGECLNDGDVCPGGEHNCVGCLSFAPPQFR